MALQGIQTPTFGGAAPRPVDRGYATPGTAPGAAPAPTTPKPAAPVTTPTPQPLPNLSQDPTYLEFVRSLGLSDADAQAMAQQATARVGAGLSNNLAQSQFQGQEGQRNIAGAMESRGLANSGEALRHLAVARTGQGFREEALRQQAAQQLESVMTNLALQQQASASRLAEVGLNRAPALDVSASLAGLGG